MTHNKGIFGWCELITRGKMMILTKQELEKLINQSQIWYILGETKHARFTPKMPYYLTLTKGDIENKGYSYIVAKDPYFPDRYALLTVYTSEEAERFIKYYEEKEKNP